MRCSHFIPCRIKLRQKYLLSKDFLFCCSTVKRQIERNTRVLEYNAIIIRKNRQVLALTYQSLHDERGSWPQEEKKLLQEGDFYFSFHFEF